VTLGEKIRRWTGWFCLGFVALIVVVGYYFRNIRFTPLAGGFLILSAVSLIELGEEQAQPHGVHPGADSRVH
jgi:hypothetical protein